jgi:NAD(P)-dependent dehydrogenase (short-subunit alcohol dehydrogenase family)
MQTRLENQIAIVTGSSSGNGRAIALALSASGATIVCADLEKKARKEGYEKDLEIDTDDVIRKQGAKACYVQAEQWIARHPRSRRGHHRGFGSGAQPMI